MSAPLDDRWARAFVARVAGMSRGGSAGVRVVDSAAVLDMLIGDARIALGLPVASDACPNPWHHSAPARRSMTCPECPTEVTP